MSCRCVLSDVSLPVIGPRKDWVSASKGFGPGCHSLPKTGLCLLLIFCQELGLEPGSAGC